MESRSQLYKKYWKIFKNDFIMLIQLFFSLLVTCLKKVMQPLSLPYQKDQIRPVSMISDQSVSQTPATK